MQSTYFISRGNSWNSLAFKFKHESTATAEREREKRETNKQSFFHSYQFLSLSLPKSEPLQKTKPLGLTYRNGQKRVHSHFREPENFFFKGRSQLWL